MSYSQFGYTYPSSSQILVSGQHPISVSPCCPASGPGSAAEVTAGSGGGGETRLLSPFPRLTPAGFGLYGYTDHHLSTLAGTATSAFYPSLPSPYDLKESRSSWSALQPSSAPACYPYDPSGLASCGPYADRYGTIDSVARRKNATRETTNTLKAWLYEHRKNPYPTKGEKIMLAIITKMTLTQVSTWFANARRRLKKENKMTWEPRNKTSEGDDRDSSSPRDKSDDNNTEDDSNMASVGGVPGIDFLKQEADTYVSKHTFSEFDDPALESKSLRVQGTKNCSSYTMNCYRTPSSEDSGTSGSPSPARPMQVPCCADRFEKGEQQQGKEAVFCDANQSFGSGPRPKIWSLARTATSNSPPLIRRYPCTDGTDGGGDCAKMKYGCPYSEFTQDRTTAVSARKNPADDLCCDRPVYGSVLPSCSVPAKCESTDCLGPSERNSCMVNSQCNYKYPSNGSEHYPSYPEKQFKNKELCAIEFPTAKCQPMDGSLDAKKLTPAVMPYPGSDPAGRTDFYGGSFEQAPSMGVLPKGTPNHVGMEIADSSSLLRRTDH